MRAVGVSLSGCGHRLEGCPAAGL